MKTRQGKKLPAKFWKDFLEAYRSNYASVTGVCRVLGISTKTYYRHLADDPEFKREIDNINDVILVPLVETALLKKAIEGDGPSQRFFLTYRGGEKWNPVLQADTYYQRQREEKLQEQYVPDDPMTALFHELFYMPITKKSIAHEYQNGKGKEFVEKECRELISAVKEHRRNMQNKKKLERAKRINKKHIAQKGK